MRVLSSGAASPAKAGKSRQDLFMRTVGIYTGAAIVLIVFLWAFNGYDSGAAVGLKSVVDGSVIVFFWLLFAYLSFAVLRSRRKTDASETEPHVAQVYPLAGKTY
jgi:hypothetical protein